MTAVSAGRQAALGRLTRAAVALLALDGAALVIGGLVVGHLPLVVAGAGLGAGALLVLWYGRWHQRQLAEIAAARAALRDEARALRELVREG